MIALPGFKTGDALSVRLIEETERLLRSTRYVYGVQFRPLAVHNGVADIEVATRDTWMHDIGVSAGRSGGSNTVTSLEMAGCSVTVSALDAPMLALWDAPVHTAALRWGV